MKDSTKLLIVIIVAIAAIIIVPKMSEPKNSSSSSTNDSGLLARSTNAPNRESTGAARGKTIGLLSELPKCIDPDRELHPGDPAYITHNGCIAKGDIYGAGVKLYDSDGSTGQVIVCLDPECKLEAKENGANVTPRSLDSVLEEMFTKGCGSACVSVKVWAITGGLASCPYTAYKNTWKAGQITSLCTDAPPQQAQAPEPSKPPFPGGSPVPGNTPTTGSNPGQPLTRQPMNDDCEPEIPMGDKRIVKKDCIVVGDVSVRPAGSNGPFVAAHDSRQRTGTVQKLDGDYEVWNYQGASVRNRDAKLESVVASEKIGGCGTGIGCPDGIYDWKGNRLDQP